jgi:hypothetical protein
MTLLPTVRRQLEQAAQRQSAHREPRWGFGGPHLPFRLGEVVVPVIAVAAALGVAAVFVVLLHHAPVRAIPASRPNAARPLLEGSGIGSVKFGESQRRAISGLQQLLGRPGSVVSRAGCGFGKSIAWDGLDIKPTSFPGDRRLFSAQLIAEFKNSRFVGYSYGDDEYIARDAPPSEVSYPLNSVYARRVLRGPRLTLATSRGLITGDSMSVGRHLYGKAFAERYREQGTPPDASLTRLPVWDASTAAGRLSGAIWHAAPAGPATNFYGSEQSSIGSIGAGAGPNTPCGSWRGAGPPRARDARVVGVVETCGGAPRGRCRPERAGLVWVLNLRNKVIASQHVTATGRFSFWLVPGRYVLHPDKPYGLPIRPVTAIARRTKTANIVFAIP